MYNYKAYAQVLDWGGHVTKIVLDGVLEGELNASDFAIDVKKYDYETGEIAQVTIDWFSKETAPAIGTMDVARAYRCDAQGNADMGGAYTALETVYGPAHPYSSIAFGKKGYTTFADVRYTIQYKGETVSAQGEVILEGKELVEVGVSKTGLNMAWVKPQIDNANPPLIIWLHGAGEGGSDPYIAILGNKVINLASEKIQSYFGGAYVFAPQCKTMWLDDGSGEYHKEGKSMYVQALMDTIEEFVAAHPEIDRRRIYIGGCSNGGFMTMRMVVDFPDYFAGAYPVCEALYDNTISDGQIEAIKNVPIWFTHAKVDKVVNPDETAVPTYKRLIAAGAKNVHFSYYERVLDQTDLFKKPDGTPHEYFGHGSWIYTLNDDPNFDFDGSPVLVDGKPVTIFQWLAAQRRF